MRQGSDRLVLGYHAISPDWADDVAVTPEMLDRQLQHIVEQGYRGATFSDVALGKVEGKAVAVTFDDGFASVADIASPILERLGLVGTAFVPTEQIAIGSRDPGDAPDARMSWQDLRSLASMGWEIGSHTRTHARLSDLSDAELEEELAGSRLACEERLGIRCSSLAYPWGDHDSRTVRAARRAGYSTAATADTGIPGDSPLRCPRVVVLRGDDLRLFRLKVSRAMRRLPVLTSGARALRLRRVERLLRRSA
jgi:peptidoglycan/xylan/chitin deacetylase (PgdA/CDA1 family)